MACPMSMDDSFSRDLKIMNGCLCLLTYDYYCQNGIDLWVMEDYAVEKSWTKLTSLKLGGNFWTLWSLTPLVYSKNKRQILLQIEREKLILYDLETKSMTTSSAINCHTSWRNTLDFLMKLLKTHQGSILLCFPFLHSLVCCMHSMQHPIFHIPGLCFLVNM